MESDVAHYALDDARDYVRAESRTRNGIWERGQSAGVRGGPCRLAIGDSPQWRAALKLASQVAATEATTCLRGESGTGKEVVARFIHDASPRKHGPFVAINCAALPEDAVESELFGFERGAFTGAQQPKPGHIELAHSGVLFLDEVTEMPLTAQAKLLRVLQERQFHRLGGTRPIAMNARVIAATNQDLKKAVAKGRFRRTWTSNQRLRHQNPTVTRARPDILLLAEHFLKGIARGNDRHAQLTTER